MKKYLLLITLVLVTVLSACEGTNTNPEINQYTLTLSSNIESITPTSVLGDVVEDDQSYTITAPEVTGYEFLYWRELNTTNVVSFDAIFDYVLSADISLEAYYDTLPEVYTITVDANITEATITNENSLRSDGTTFYELTAPDVDGYSFQKWIDTSDSSTLSYSPNYTFTAIKTIDIQAVYNEIEVPVVYEVIVTANIVDAVVTNNNTLTNSGATQYELIAPTVSGYTFKYWTDKSDSSVIYLEQTYSFVATKDILIEAVYQETTASSEPTLFYETEFEDGSKQAYADGILTLSGKDWRFYDALLNPASGDREVSGKSVRIRDGYLASEFKVGDLAQVIFWSATYGGDSNNTITFEISVDKTNWVVVESYATTDEILEHSIVFNDALFTSLSLNPDSEYYLRIVSPTTDRTNIDNFQIYTGEGVVIDDTPLYTINISNDMGNTYLLGETIDLSLCTATHSVNGDTTCDVIEAIDNMTPGVYVVTFFKADEFGNVATDTMNVTIIDGDIDYLTMDLDTYYDDAEGLYGSALMDELHAIINTGFSGVTYGDARYILDDANQDPLNPSNLILVYFGTSVNGAWDGGLTWNREHVWPQSLLGVSADNGTVNSASDLYNLMPANPGENSSRSNDPYSEMGLGYEPRDEMKGDLARALFYMMIMYDELDLVDSAPSTYEMGYLSELLEWHYEDPVDDFELNRLEVIFGAQYNRNPFVDYPHFVDLIWFSEGN